MRQKVITFVLMISLCISFIGCQCFEDPANAERIGSGYIRQERGNCYVEIDSVRYYPERVYTNSSGRDGKNMMAPVEGMKVTCFRLYGNPKVNFIAGEHSQEYLEDYFTTNSTFAIVFAGIAILCVVGLASARGTKKIHIVQDQ